jgi:CubicO group peptidase (beta-lactamase class C family)
MARPVVEGAYGGNDIDTKFRFGSMGKMFTAVAALQLIQAGKLALGRTDRQIPS